MFCQCENPQCAHTDTKQEHHGNACKESVTCTIAYITDPKVRADVCDVCKDYFLNTGQWELVG